MTFLIAFFVATAFFIPFLITGHGYFIFFGDFNVQQIPFYRYCHDAVRNGQFGWSYVTDLGSNFIGSYAFYLLGSPFFWLTIPFPGSVVPLPYGSAADTEVFPLRLSRHTFTYAALPHAPRLP